MQCTRKPLVTYLYYMVRNLDLAVDLSQEAFLRALDGQGLFKKGREGREEGGALLRVLIKNVDTASMDLGNIH